MSQEQIIKIILLGSSDVGKADILHHNFDISIQNSMPTIGIDFQTKFFKFDDSKIKVNFIDTLGQEKFRGVSINYLKGKDGVMLVYDVSKRDTFELIEKFIDDIKINSKKNIGKILIGNKVDLESDREVSKEEGEKLAESFQCKYYEICSQTGLNVKEAIDEIARITYLEWKKIQKKVIL